MALIHSKQQNHDSGSSAGVANDTTAGNKFQIEPHQFLMLMPIKNMLFLGANLALLDTGSANSASYN